MLKLIIFIIIFTTLQSFCFACDMMALISIDGSSISGLPEIEGGYNDPYDFFEYMIERSDSLLNNDGYGILYYKDSETILDSTQIWYKIGHQRWYGDGTEEPLDIAIAEIMNENNHPVIVLGHDRNGSTGYGSHPFTFEWQNTTYTFMHNGTVTSDIKAAMMNYLGEEWFDRYPSNWNGQFGILNSFIDSELLFHYIMKFVLENNGDIILGIYHALNNQNVEGYNLPEELSDGSPVINFVMSDGESLFIFRNTSLNGDSHNLSYERIRTGFYGIKTQSSLENQIPRNTLVVIPRTGQPQSISFYNPQFSVQENIDYLPFEVSFTDESNGEPTDWQWDFQDDGIYDSFQQHPTFIYDTPGIYDVKLKIRSPVFEDSIIKHNLITVFDTIPPLKPTGIEIAVYGNDVVLIWTENDPSQPGNDIFEPYFLIYHSRFPDRNFSFTDYTTETFYIHQGATAISDKMFYRVRAFVGPYLELEGNIKKKTGYIYEDIMIEK